MEAKDTVMGKVQRDNIFYRGIGTLEGVCQMQAEISFKAGRDEGVKDSKAIDEEVLRITRQEGRKDVVEWIEPQMEIGIANKGTIYLFTLHISKQMWQAKLKEWGLSE